jgi:hypothetical protein
MLKKSRSIKYEMVKAFSAILVILFVFRVSNAQTIDPTYSAGAGSVYRGYDPDPDGAAAEWSSTCDGRDKP